jgi:hypothetical protein
MEEHGRHFKSLEVGRRQRQLFCIAMHIAPNSVPARVDTITYQDSSARGLSI